MKGKSDNPGIPLLRKAKLEELDFHFFGGGLLPFLQIAQYICLKALMDILSVDMFMFIYIKAISKTIF